MVQEFTVSFKTNYQKALLFLASRQAGMKQGNQYSVIGKKDKQKKQVLVFFIWEYFFGFSKIILTNSMSH